MRSFSSYGAIYSILEIRFLKKLGFLKHLGNIVRHISYGPIAQEPHYYVPRKKLIDKALQELKGDNPNKGGH
jgi:hypothetical protein